MQWNCMHCLRQKLLALENILLRVKIHICLIGEIWLESQSNLKLSSFNIFRQDRDKSYGVLTINPL